MEIISHALMLGGGIIIGLILIPLVKQVGFDDLNVFLTWVAGAIARPCARLFRWRRLPAPSLEASQNEAMREVDAREKQISDSAQTIRTILLDVAKVIQHTDKAASDSSQALDDVKESFDQMELPADLVEAHQIVLREIDRVLASNTLLKGELASTQETLADQRRQIENLRTAVRIDALTQLANRAYFDEKLAECLSTLKRYHEPFALMMIDLDNFKEINDTHGHPAGDRILKGVAFKIRESLRGSDFLARFGGDEFALILPKADARTASDVAWKLCHNVRESRFLLDSVAITVTLSIGVTLAYAADEEDTILKRADSALYQVKQSGRDGNLLLEAQPV